MKRLLPLVLLLLVPALPLFALEDEVPLSTSRSAYVPIPLSTGWVEGFLLIIVWLFIIAILVGPLVNYFQLEPRSKQVFSDDKKIRTH